MLYKKIGSIAGMREKEEVAPVTQYANVDIIFIGATVLSAVYIISDVYQIKISDRIY
jgi:hypothetical protein